MTILLHRFRCPNCKGKLKLRRLFDSRYIVECERCDLNRIIKPQLDSNDEAYLKLLADYDEGSIDNSEGIDKLLTSEKIIRSEAEIDELISSNYVTKDDLPRIVRESLLSKMDYVVAYRNLMADKPDMGSRPSEFKLMNGISDVLKDSGISRLYAFQEEAWKNIMNGRNVVIVAPTGGGKTEAFACPIFAIIADEVKKSQFSGSENRVVRSLFIYPTKALARDQLHKLEKIASRINISIKVFDGDTSSRDKVNIVDNPPDIIITNFDTLHYHLIHRTKFSQLISTVSYIVVDEIHVYTGIFGTNVHFILRRLKRICRGFQWIGASATIENAGDFSSQLFGDSPKIIDVKGFRKGILHLAMIFPSLRSHRSLILGILRRSVSDGYRTIVFSNSHLGAELTGFYGKRDGIAIAVHRAGLLPTNRKIIEEQFKKGILKAIAATPTLELGIDIGSVDAIISDLVPLNRLIQRTGRAGRRGQESVAFLALRENDPISQYYKNHPDDYFSDIQPGYIDPNNEVIADLHILAASFDKPIYLGEFPEYLENITRLERNGLLKTVDDRIIPEYKSALSVLKSLDIRGSGERVSIRFLGKKMGERSMPQAMEELHPEAIYFLGGNRYKSQSFQFTSGSGHADIQKIPSNYPYYTKPLIHEWPTIVKVLDRKTVYGVDVSYCNLMIDKTVMGYVNLKIGVDSKVGQRISLENQISYKFVTKGFTLRAPYPRNILDVSQEEQIDHITTSSFHATEHLVIEGSNMITGGASQDMGGISLGNSGMIFVHDSSRGGNGASKALYDRLEKAFSRAFQIVLECQCTSLNGCPRCTYSYRCGNNNDYLHKEASQEVLQRILDGEETTIEEIEEESGPPYV